MNEQDERVIYEWLGYKDAAPYGDGWAYPTPIVQRNRDGSPEIVGAEPNQCPPLDMNLAFGECIPKLDEAACTVIFKRSAVDLDYRDGYWRIIWGGYPAKIDEACNDDFYAALLAYIKGVR